MTKVRTRVIAILLAVVVVISGLMLYNDYYQTKLENGAYKYLNEELYGCFSNLVVNEITSVGDGYYDIGYTYEREDGHTIIGEHYSVKL